MTWLDHSRRLVVLLLVVLGLLWAPSVASARFTATRSPTLAVATDRMETPAGVTGSYRCAWPFLLEGVDLDVDSFTDAGPAGATYDYTLTGRRVSVTDSSPTRSASLSSGSVVNDGTATQWTLTIRSHLGSWTGPAYTRTITCPAAWSKSGSL